MPGSQTSSFFCSRKVLIPNVMIQWVIYDLCPRAPDSIQSVPGPNTYHRVSFSSLNTGRRKSCTSCHRLARAHHLFTFQQNEKDLGLISRGGCVWDGDKGSGANGRCWPQWFSQGRSHKQSRSIVGCVGGGGKSAPSVAGPRKQEIQLGSSLF